MVQALKNIGLFLLGFGFLWAMLRFDMKTGGNIAAKHIHHNFPGCSDTCHK